MIPVAKINAAYVYRSVGLQDCVRRKFAFNPSGGCNNLERTGGQAAEHD